MEQIRTALAAFPNSPELCVLLGDAIQLSDDDVHYSLEDAEQSYRRAAELAPTDPAPLVSLGYFYYAVLDRTAESVGFFEKAIALGGGDEAENGLAEAHAELANLRDDVDSRPAPEACVIC